jgi:hypothetical protein
VIALLRYQAANLLRSHRWILPLIVFALLISVGGAGGGGQAGSGQEAAHLRAQALASGLDWNAAIVLVVTALLTRLMVTAEPGAARACVAAARGSGRAQLATLLTAFAGGAILGLAGACYELLTVGHGTALLGALLAGLGKALICAFVGSAVGTLFNAPVIRHQAVALLSTIAAVVVALVSSVSPANAAMHGNGAAIQSAAWPAGVPMAAAFALVVVSWSASCWLAGRRSD